MIRCAILLLHLCLHIMAKEETHEIPWALADMAMDLNMESSDYNMETETGDIDNDMFDMLLTSAPYHIYSQDRRQIRDKIRNSKKIRKQKRIKPHQLTTISGNA